MGPDSHRPAVSAIDRAFVAVNRFFAELKRRKVYTVAIAYLCVGCALAHGISQLLPVFDIPIWVVRLVVLLIVLGCPVALVLSWFFDFTRYRIVPTPDLKDKIDILPSATSNERSIVVLLFMDLCPSEECDYLVYVIEETIQT